MIYEKNLSYGIWRCKVSGRQRFFLHLKDECNVLLETLKDTLKIYFLP